MVAIFVYHVKRDVTLDAFVASLETHLAVLKQTRYKLALLNTLDLLLGQRLLGFLNNLSRLVLPGDGLGPLFAANTDFVDLGDALAANKFGMDLFGMVYEHGASLY
jgi:hypothetical protein